MSGRAAVAALHAAGRLTDELRDADRTGRVTLRELAQRLAVDVWAAHDLLRANGVAVAQGHRDESAVALRTLLDER
jgi:hypothetical protein